MLDEFRKIDIKWEKASEDIYEQIKVMSSDETGRKLVVQVLDDGVPIKQDGVTLDLHWTADSNEFSGAESFKLIDKENSIYELYFGSELLSNIGKSKSNLELTDIEGKVTSNTFYIEVFEGADMTATQSPDATIRSTRVLSGDERMVTKERVLEKNLLDDFRRIDIQWEKASDKIYESIKVMSSDETGRKLVVQVLDESRPIDTLNIRLDLYWETESKKNRGLDEFRVIDAENSIFEMYFTTGLLSNVGTLKSNLIIRDEKGVITSNTFYIEVLEGIDWDATQSSDSFSSLTEIMKKIEEIPAQEEARILKEVERIRSERARVSAESTRADSESERISKESIRKSSEVERVDSESNRKLRETEREEGEASRKSSEDVRVSSEESRVLAETARGQFESERKIEEALREENEQQREASEQGRKSAESERETNESVRRKAETERVENEEVRELAESERITNEEVREQVEDERKSKEEIRILSEAERLTSETSRINEESRRTTNETDRIDNEGERIGNEEARTTAESQRELNEDERISSESTRVDNEQQREANESLRKGSETERVSVEQSRITAENERSDLYDLVQRKLENGEFVGEKGDTGDGLEYIWDGTQLGVRKEGETEYVYVDLKGDKGDKGDTGEIESLDSSHIVDALGYMPISTTDVPDPTWANLQNKPTEFNPASHTHDIDDVEGLRAELDSVPELTKENVGLGNVDNVKQASKSEFDGHNNDATRHITSVERTKWNAVDNKVDKVTGKGLSANDYTTTEKNKLAGIEAGANKYTHPGSGTNPHGTTKSDIGLGSVDNVKQATKTEFDALNNEVNEHKADYATETEYGHVKVGERLLVADGRLSALKPKLVIEKFDSLGTYTWTAPKGVTEVYITGCGGGGGSHNSGTAGGISSFGNLLSLAGGGKGGLSTHGGSSGGEGGSPGVGGGGDFIALGGGTLLSTPTPHGELRSSTSSVSTPSGYGYGSHASASRSSSGGGGETVLDKELPVTPETTYTITVGDAGNSHAGTGIIIVKYVI